MPSSTPVDRTLHRLVNRRSHLIASTSAQEQELVLAKKELTVMYRKIHYLSKLVETNKTKRSVIEHEIVAAVNVLSSQIECATC